MFVSLEKYRPQMLSILRIFVALLYLQAGLSKYFGWPGTQPKDFTMFSLLGAAGAIELVGSLLLLAGLWTREAAFIMSGEMAVAYLLRRVLTGASFFPIVNGGMLESLFCFVFLYFVFAGPGPWSVDAKRAKG
jgi:putative oxidoreductase